MEHLVFSTGFTTEERPYYSELDISWLKDANNFYLFVGISSHALVFSVLRKLVLFARKIGFIIGSWFFWLVMDEIECRTDAQ